MGRVVLKASLGVAGLMALAGCSGKAPERPTPEESAAEVVLIVNNHTYNDFDIFVDHDGQRSLVGQVVASASATLNIPRGFLGMGRQVSLHGAPIGGNRRVTFQNTVMNAKPINSEVVTVQPGMLMEWTLESDLTKSTLVLH